MKLTKNQIGKIGEAEALKFLLNNGYRVIEKNFRCNLGELDLIVSPAEGELIFVEVRARTNTSFGEPYETVGRLKQDKLYRLAEYYLNFKKHQALACRFDVISVILSPDGKLKKLEHIENAFGM